MSQTSPRHLPPEALEEWMSKIADLLQIEEEVDIGAILDLTRDVAHDVARPAAPLTTFALGLALGRAPGSEYEPRFRELCDQLTRMAREHEDQ